MKSNVVNVFVAVDSGPIITLPSGGLTHPIKLSWWLPYPEQSIPDSGSRLHRDPPLPRALATAVVLLKLMRNLEGRDKRVEGLEVVDTDKPAGCCI